MASIRKSNVSIAMLREIISYDQVSGKLYWRERCAKHFQNGRHSAEHTAAKWNARYAGRPALTAIEVSGYGHGDIFGKRYKAHRVAWALYYGKWPDSEIDHINGDPADNRIENLRCVTKEQNMRNQRRSIANKSGVTGVCWASHRSKWSAQIKVGGRKHHLGLFSVFADAVKVRKDAERRLGFHPNHGRSHA